MNTNLKTVVFYVEEIIIWKKKKTVALMSTTGGERTCNNTELRSLTSSKTGGNDRSEPTVHCRVRQTMQHCNMFCWRGS